MLPLILLHNLGPLAQIRADALGVLRVGQHHLQPVAADLLAVQRRHRLLGALLARVLDVAARLARQQVDVDQVAEPAEHVFEDVDERVVGGAHDEQAFRHRRVCGRQGLGRRQLHRTVGWIVRLLVGVGGGDNAAGAVACVTSRLKYDSL